MAKAVPPESVAPAVVAMITDEWGATGEIYLGGRRTHGASFHRGQTWGIDGGVDWTPEDALSHIAAVLDIAGFATPRSDFDVAARYVLRTEDGSVSAETRLVMPVRRRSSQRAGRFDRAGHA